MLITLLIVAGSVPVLLFHGEVGDAEYPQNVILISGVVVFLIPILAFLRKKQKKN
jgi:hypothetical protein